MEGHKAIKKVIRLYKMKTGETKFDPAEVAKFALQNRVEPPIPADLLKPLVKQISEAARKATRIDRGTGRPYYAYHFIPVKQGQEAPSFWVDIDDASRSQMVLSTNRRREQSVRDVVQLSFDLDHWAAVNPGQKPIGFESDFTRDIGW